MQFASEDLIKEHDGILFGLQVLEEMAHLISDHPVSYTHLTLPTIYSV